MRRPSAEGGQDARGDRTVEGAAPGGAPERDGGFPVRRALILNGIILVAVLVAVVFGSNGGPASITFQPTPWRCDGTERSWTAPVPARALEIRIEWRDGGPEGELRASSTTARAALEPYANPDGTFRVATTDTAAPECGLDAGGYTMALRDAASNALLASGTVELAP